MIAAVTAIISLIVTALGLGNAAALFAGFVPGRASLGFGGDMAGLLPVVLTPLSATLVHGGLFHLASNLLMLIYTGIAVERAIGSRGVLVLYGVGAYASAVAQWLPDPNSPVPMVGASGAISAIFGAYALLYGQRRLRDFGPLPGWLLQVAWLLAAWVVLNIAVGLVAARAGFALAVAAHVGGFLAGLALARPLLAWRWRRA